jgi:hypothetical protein
VRAPPVAGRGAAHERPREQPAGPGQQQPTRHGGEDRGQQARAVGTVVAGDLPQGEGRARDHDGVADQASRPAAGVLGRPQDAAGQDPAGADRHRQDGPGERHPERGQEGAVRAQLHVPGQERLDERPGAEHTCHDPDRRGHEHERQWLGRAEGDQRPAPQPAQPAERDVGCAGVRGARHHERQHAAAQRQQLRAEEQGCGTRCRTLGAQAGEQVQGRRADLDGTGLALDLGLPPPQRPFDVGQLFRSARDREQRPAGRRGEVRSRQVLQQGQRDEHRVQQCRELVTAQRPDRGGAEQLRVAPERPDGGAGAVDAGDHDLRRVQLTGARPHRLHAEVRHADDVADGQSEPSGGAVGHHHVRGARAAAPTHEPQGGAGVVRPGQQGQSRTALRAHPQSAGRGQQLSGGAERGGCGSTDGTGDRGHLAPGDDGHRDRVRRELVRQLLDLYLPLDDLSGADPLAAEGVLAGRGPQRPEPRGREGRRSGEQHRHRARPTPAQCGDDQPDAGPQHRRPAAPVACASAHRGTVARSGVRSAFCDRIVLPDEVLSSCATRGGPAGWRALMPGRRCCNRVATSTAQQ